MLVAASAAHPTPAPAPASRAASVIASPIVKWPGGKTKLLPELVKRAPETFGRYYEPFVGGAALFFRLAPARAVLNDFNADLINVYASVRDSIESVIEYLRHHRSEHAIRASRHYYRTRNAWNSPDHSDTPAQRAAMFVYLNKTCFNGLWRVNRAGEFNVPIGRYTNPPICAPDALRAARVALQRAELEHGDYRASIASAVRGDFIYIDPPYDPATKTASFTSYTTSAFGRDQQAELADVARDLVARGCKVMLSNSDTPFVRSLYRGRAGVAKTFKISRVTCARSINSNAGKRGKVNEVIITGGY